MTSIDEQIAFIERRIRAGTDAEFYRGILASLERIKSLDAQPVPVEPDVCEFSPSFDPDYSGPTEWVPKYQFDSMQSALKLAQEERDNEKEVRNCISRAYEAEQKRAEKAEALAEQFRKDYMELIMAVAKKYPNETRHQTALRYILEREQPSKDQCAVGAIYSARAE